MKILEVRPEQVICLEETGVVTTRPNSPYYSMRYFKYNSKRIDYHFSEESYVMETYDERIFNCWHEGARVQLRQDLSEKLCAAINHHEMYGNIREYAELFKTAFEEIPNWEILDLYLKNIRGVEKTQEGFVVYDDFLIDYQGNAWVRPQHEKFILFSSKEFAERWHSLCIVMKGTKHSDSVEKGASLPDEFGAMVKVNALTMTIISKLMFLLNPNLKDQAFTGQLSKNLLLRLNKLRGGDI